MMVITVNKYLMVRFESLLLLLASSTGSLFDLQLSLQL